MVKGTPRHVFPSQESQQSYHLLQSHNQQRPIPFLGIEIFFFFNFFFWCWSLIRGKMRQFVQLPLFLYFSLAFFFGGGVARDQTPNLMLRQSSTAQLCFPLFFLYTFFCLFWGGTFRSTHLAVLRNFFPGRFGGLSGILMIEPQSALCKASSPPAVLSLFCCCFCFYDLCSWTFIVRAPVRSRVRLCHCGELPTDLCLPDWNSFWGKRDAENPTLGFGPPGATT